MVGTGEFVLSPLACHLWLEIRHEDDVASMVGVLKDAMQ